MPRQAEREPKEIQSVQRAISIIGCFDARNAMLTLSEISEMTGINKSTVYGIIYTLCKYGYLDKGSKGGQYCLGPELARKGLLVTANKHNSLELIGIPFLKRLMANYNVTCYLFAYQNGGLTCLEMLIPSNSSYGAVSGVLGKKMAYHAAASGKVALAHLNEVQLQKHMQQAPFFAFTQRTLTTPEAVLEDIQRTQKNGYAFEDEEIDIDLSAISVPIYNPEHDLIGTISVSGKTHWMHDIKADIVKDMKNFSHEISSTMFARQQGIAL